MAAPTNTTQPIQTGKSTGLWSQLTKDVQRAVAGVIDRRSVVSISDAGQITATSSDPNDPDTHAISRLRNLNIQPGDDVLTVRIGGGEVVVGVIPKPGQADDFTDELNRIAVLESLVNPVTRGVAAGYFYGPLTTLSGGTIGTSLLTANTMRLVPFLCPANVTFDQIGVEVTTVAGAGGTIQFGIYDIGPDGLASTLIASLGTVDTTAIGYRPSPAISLTLPRGLYWIGGAANQNVTIKALSGAGMTAVIGQYGTTGTNPISALAKTMTAGFSTLPATITAPSNNVYVSAFQLRAA